LLFVTILFVLNLHLQYRLWLKYCQVSLKRWRCWFFRGGTVHYLIVLFTPLKQLRQYKSTLCCILVAIEYLGLYLLEKILLKTEKYWWKKFVDS
jgi:hypothetical protein